jgi:hypothetical protein
MGAGVKVRAKAIANPSRTDPSTTCDRRVIDFMIDPSISAMARRRQAISGAFAATSPRG